MKKEKPIIDVFKGRIINSKFDEKLSEIVNGIPQKHEPVRKRFEGNTRELVKKARKNEKENWIDW